MLFCEFVSPFDLLNYSSDWDDTLRNYIGESLGRLVCAVLEGELPVGYFSCVTGSYRGYPKVTGCALAGRKG